jgi:SAM-dependent methyltransferase
MPANYSARSVIAEEVPPVTAPGCAVCGGSASEPWKQGDPGHDLRPEDFHITDSRYGMTLPLVRCQSCGFIYAPAANAPEILGLYERMEDPEYDSPGSARPLQMEWIVRIARKQHPKAATLLDIGAGTGMLVAEARKQGLAAQGVEPSFALSGLAIQRGLPVAQGVYPHPDLAGRRYDIVCLVDVIEHVERPDELLRDAASALAPGGLLVVITPDISSVAARLLGKRWWHLRLAHIGYFDPGTFGKLASRLGLDVASTLRAQWFFPLAYLAERVEVYLPWIKPLNRLCKRLPLLGRIYRLVIPVNLRDSSVFLLRKGRPS